MKKFFVLLTAICLVLSMAVSVSAATNDDLIKKLEEIPAANNKSFHDGAVRIIKEENLPADQIDKLIPLLEEAKQVLPENKGAAARDYTVEQVEKIFDILDRACEITGYSYVVTTFEKGTDVGIKVYRPDQSLMLEYTDGVIKATGVEETKSALPYVYLACGALLLASAGAVIIIRKKING